MCSSYHLVTVTPRATRVPSPSREDAVGDKAVRSDREALGPGWARRMGGEGANSLRGSGWPVVVDDEAQLANISK